MFFARFVAGRSFTQWQKPESLQPHSRVPQCCDLQDIPPATERLRSQLHQFSCQLHLPGSKHRFMHSPAVGKLAFWFKSPSNAVAYEYNPINHSQTCTHNFASMNQRDAIVNTVRSSVFFLGEMVYSSMCSAFQACCLPCSAGCPLPCSIWQIRGDTLPFPSLPPACGWACDGSFGAALPPIARLRPAGGQPATPY